FGFSHWGRKTSTTNPQRLKPSDSAAFGTAKAVPFPNRLINLVWKLARLKLCLSHRAVITPLQQTASHVFSVNLGALGVSVLKKAQETKGRDHSRPFPNSTTI